MSDQQLVLTYVREQMDSLCQRPEMWGPNLCVELQFLMLMDFWVVVTSPRLGRERPRLVLDEYHAFRRREGLDAKRPVADTTSPPRFTKLLEAFRAEFMTRVAPTVLAAFERDVGERFPLATTRIGASPENAARSSLFIQMADRAISVEWTSELGFNVTRASSIHSGESTRVTDSQHALQRIAVLLRGVVSLTVEEGDRFRTLALPADLELTEAPDEVSSDDAAFAAKTAERTLPISAPRKRKA